MTFPTIPTVAAGRVITGTQADTNSSRVSPDLSGLTKNSGDLLIAICIIYQGTGVSNQFSGWTSGWTELSDGGTATGMGRGIAYRWSDGSETGTITVNQATAVTGHCAWIVMSIAGAHASSPPEAGSQNSGTSSAPASPSLNPTGWDVEDTLWISIAGSGETNTSGSYSGIASPPTAYSDMVDTGISADVVGGVVAAVSFRQIAIASQTPGAWSLDLSNARNMNMAMAVRPAAEAASADMACGIPI